jgi:hypothetical protein
VPGSQQYLVGDLLEVSGPTGLQMLTFRDHHRLPTGASAD